MGSEKLCPSAPQNFFRDAKCPGVSHDKKKYISHNAYEHSDFLTVGENIYRIWTAFKQTLRRRRRRGRGRYV